MKWIDGRLAAAKISTSVEQACKEPVEESTLAWYSGESLLEKLKETYELEPWHQKKQNWLIALIIIGSLLAVGGVIWLTVYCLKQRNLKKQLSADEAGPYSGI